MTTHNTIAPLLTAYLLGDLDEVRSAMVREHLATCALCKTDFAELESTVGILKQALAAKPTPSALSPERREKVLSTKAKKVIPFFGWFTKRHTYMSRAAELLIIFTLVVVIAGMFFPAVSMSKKSARIAHTRVMEEMRQNRSALGELELPESEVGRDLRADRLEPSPVFQRVESLPDASVAPPPASETHKQGFAAKPPSENTWLFWGQNDSSPESEATAAPVTPPSPEPNQWAGYLAKEEGKAKKDADGGSGGPALPTDQLTFNGNLLGIDVPAAPQEQVAYNEPITRSRGSTFKIDDAPLAGALAGTGDKATVETELGEDGVWRQVDGDTVQEGDNVYFFWGDRKTESLSAPAAPIVNDRDDSKVGSMENEAQLTESTWTVAGWPIQDSRRQIIVPTVAASGPAPAAESSEVVSLPGYMEMSKNQADGVEAVPPAEELQIASAKPADQGDFIDDEVVTLNSMGQGTSVSAGGGVTLEPLKDGKMFDVVVEEEAALPESVDTLTHYYADNSAAPHAIKIGPVVESSRRASRRRDEPTLQGAEASYRDIKDKLETHYMETQEQYQELAKNNADPTALEGAKRQLDSARSAYDELIKLGMEESPTSSDKVLSFDPRGNKTDATKRVPPADMQIAGLRSVTNYAYSILTNDTIYYYRFYATNGTVTDPYHMQVAFTGYSSANSFTNFPSLISIPPEITNFTYAMTRTNTMGEDMVALAGQSKAWNSTDRSSTNLYVWNGNGWKSYWLYDNNVTQSGQLNRRWWDPASNAYANITLEPGMAFYFWNSTNSTSTRPSTNFMWVPRTDGVEAVPPQKEEDSKGPRFKAFGVNPFVNTVENAFSTFSIDVDTASYTVMRNYVAKGFLPPAEAVRTEEFVNFFDYGYKAPTHDTFQIFAECAPSKFGHGLNLLKIGVKGRRLGREEEKPSVLTFLIDTSGSMDTPDRIGLVKKSLKLLVANLSPKDKICIIQYNTHARIVLEMTSISDLNAVLSAIDTLECSGSTNLEEAMRTAYSIASANIMPGSENRVLLLSDGVANLGSDKADDILNMVAHSRHQGLFCSVLGFGIGTYDDAMLEELANKGDGIYTFIDSEEEAKRVLVDDLSATLNTIAADVKIQVEFNPAYVTKYRQLGYENRQLKQQDFRNDSIDAGEIGSGQSVTALYELGITGPYRPTRITPPEAIATIRVRYRRLDTGRIEEIEKKIMTTDLSPSFDQTSARFKLAATVAEFSEILRGSPHAEGSSIEGVAETLRPVAQDLYLDKRIQEFMSVVDRANSLPRGE